MASVTPLRITPIRWEGLGPPSRALRMDCRILNPNPVDLFISDAWLDVRIANGPRLCEGRFFHTEYAMAFPAIVLANEGAAAGGEIVIPLSPAAIEIIEMNRKGGDLTIEIDARVLTCAVSKSQGGALVLLNPMETQFSSGGSGSSIHATLPQSEWVKLLQRMQWTQFALMEFPTELLRADPRLAGARERLHEAESRFWVGDWEGTIESCRKAWEAAARTLTASDTNTEALKKVGAQLNKQPKTAALDDLARAFGTFVHLARHDQPGGMMFARNDAMLSINLTTAMIAFLAHLF